MYILLLSIHGLIRGHDLELGRDPDTGGQTLYVVNLARALAERDDVERVDLVTRRIVDPVVSSDYAEAIEPLSDKARILRIDDGPEEYETYNMDRRVDAEEEVLASADLVIASTNNELDEQYGLYDYYQPKRMAVIPPRDRLESLPPAEARRSADRFCR